ncbi:mechanosensitive ion channel family protein [Halosimplex pelagicum]|uniref:Mechanosensitive ion channel family protein n=1 Tax=Halosimplex pelagicum TaxID=869886 RepID=A0A7D5PCM8_9EURY|nr:mechanosensitive ion channel family protein [Halosimplex pelagicum]QLH83485.1 mechanosensitive ion channel family protein [Halosimplex pelagicum]
MLQWARALSVAVGQTATPSDGTATPGGTATAGNASVPGTETALSWLPDWIVQILDITPTPVIQLVQSLVVVALAYLLSQLLVRLLGRRIARRFRRPSLTRTALRGIRGIVFLFAVLTIMGIYGYELSDLTLSVAVFSAVIGVILAPIVGSVIGGVFLLADQPYEIGDMIELADRNQRGFVEDITLRYTKVFTLDNTFIVIPNGTMRERDVINYSAEDTRTRQSLDVLVTYESDVARARQLVEDAARNVDGVVSGGPQIRVGAARYPAGPTCYIDEFGDHGINLRLRYWVEEPYWLLRIRSRIQTSFDEAITDEGVEIAYPHQHHVFDETSGEMQVGVADRPTGQRPPGDPTDRPDESTTDGDGDGAGDG